MTHWLDWILIWAAARLPDEQGAWVDDLRHEAQHVPKGFRRLKFLWGGVFAALGAVLFVSIGPKRVGQALIGTSIGVLCLAVFIFTLKIEEPIAKLVIYGVMGLYMVAGGLVMTNLRYLKGFALGSSFSLCAIWAALGASRLVPPDAPLEFMRAFTIEAAVFMMGLFIAATYLDWMEKAENA